MVDQGAHVTRISSLHHFLKGGRDSIWNFCSQLADYHDYKSTKPQEWIAINTFWKFCMGTQLPSRHLGGQCGHNWRGGGPVVGKRGIPPGIHSPPCCRVPGRYPIGILRHFKFNGKSSLSHYNSINQYKENCLSFCKSNYTNFIWYIIYFGIIPSQSPCERKFSASSSMFFFISMTRRVLFEIRTFKFPGQMYALCQWKRLRSSVKCGILYK